MANKIIKIFIPILFILGAFGYFIFYIGNGINAANEEDCSVISNPNEKLECLRREYDRVQKERNELEKQIEQEKKNQNSLIAQVNLLANQISSLEMDITSTQLQIESLNIEINIINQEIRNTQNQISITTQEVSVIEADVSQSVADLYKLLSVDQIEITLVSADMWQNINDAKYIELIQEENEKAVLSLDEKSKFLTESESNLQRLSGDSINKKAEVEKVFGELALKKEQLVASKNSFELKLSESQKLAQQLDSNLKKVQSYENDVANQVTTLIMELYNSGQLGTGVKVKKGDIIGFEGHSGCSLGAHLHFAVYKNNVAQNPLNYISTSGSYLTNNDTYNSPMTSALITQYYSSGHAAIDLVSMDPLYANTGKYYSLTEEELRTRCPWSPQTFVNWAYSSYGNPPWYFRMTGEGAPVKSIADGTVYKSTEYNGGGKYVIIDHGNGITSLYLHLKE